MQVNLLSLKISQASRMSDLADRVITALTAIGTSAAFLEVLRIAGSSAAKTSARSSSSSTSGSSSRATPSAKRPTSASAKPFRSSPRTA